MLSVFSALWFGSVLSQGLSPNLLIGSAVLTGALGIYVTLPQIQTSADIRGSVWPGNLPASTTPGFSRGCWGPEFICPPAKEAGCLPSETPQPHPKHIFMVYLWEARATPGARV